MAKSFGGSWKKLIICIPFSQDSDTVTVLRQNISLVNNLLKAQDGDGKCILSFLDFSGIFGIVNYDILLNWVGGLRVNIFLVGQIQMVWIK